MRLRIKESIKDGTMRLRIGEHSIKKPIKKPVEVVKAKGRAEQVAEEIEQAPARSAGILKRAYEGVASPRQAIKANCLTCTHFDRDQIARCPVYRCTLWKYRPFQGK